MGPFIYKPHMPPTQERIAEIVRQMQSNALAWEITDRMHDGRWRDNASYIQCMRAGCAYHTEGPSRGLYDDAHLSQWQWHRAEMAIEEGIL